MGLDQATIEGLRAMIRVGGARQVTVGDLRADEVAELTWSGKPAHLRSIATTLISAGERRVHDRGLAFAALGAEDNNPWARHLCQRLGYQAAGRQYSSWETENDTGSFRVYETTLTILRKRL